MIQLNTHFSEYEKEILFNYAGSAFEILPYVEGDSYILSEGGEYGYNECFGITDIDAFARQRYEKVIPYRVIKFYQFYLMNTEEDAGHWYRGRKDYSGNWEYDCVTDNLEEAFESL